MGRENAAKFWVWLQGMERVQKSSSSISAFVSCKEMAQLLLNKNIGVIGKILGIQQGFFHLGISNSGDV